MLGIASLQVDKTKVKKVEFNKFEKELQTFMNNYKFLTVEFATNFKDKISNLVDNRENKERKSNEITA